MTKLSDPGAGGNLPPDRASTPSASRDFDSILTSVDAIAREEGSYWLEVEESTFSRTCIERVEKTLPRGLKPFGPLGVSVAP
jgi:hypothetical protein